MIRLLILCAALAVATGGSFRLAAETRYRLVALSTVGELLERGAEDPSGVVFVFQPEDCFGDGALVKTWKHLQESGRVGVRGKVVGGLPSDRQALLFGELNLVFSIEPITLDAAAVVAERLGYSSTPFAVVLDRSGRVVGSYAAGQNVPAEILEGMVAAGGSSEPLKRGSVR